MVPLPIFFRENLSVDHDGLARYVAWLLDAGMNNTCLTYAYSQIEHVSERELVDVTKTIADVIGDRAVFIGCTHIDTTKRTTSLLNRIKEAGAHAAFAMPELDGWSPERYSPHLAEVAASSDLPLLLVNNVSPADPASPVFSVESYSKLLKHGSIVGLKEDYNSIAYRNELIREYGDRLCIIGGGVQRNYVLFHHHPNQGELFGQFSPQSALDLMKLLDEERLRDALAFIDRRETAIRESLIGLNFIARNQAYFYKMGFVKSPKLRPPLVAATKEQADKVVSVMKGYPDVFPELGEAGTTPSDN